MEIWTRVTAGKHFVRLAGGKEIELPKDEKYHHVAETCDGKFIKLYIDGRFVDEVKA